MNKLKGYITSAILTMLTYFSFDANAQRIKAEVDRNRIFIGEEVLLKLTMDQASPGSSWIRVPDSVNHFEVIGRRKIDTITVGSTKTYQQVISITSFDSGRWQIPGFAAPGLNQITIPITIDVVPVDVSHMQDYNEIKEIEEVPAGTSLFIIGLIATITLLSIAAIYYLFSRKKKTFVSPAVGAGKMTPLEWAFSEINKLQGKELLAPVEVKKYYSELHEISRKFFEMQLKQKSLQKTTDEWMINLKEIPVENSVRTSFFQFLRLADTVKFAKYLPPSFEHTSSVSAIKEMLQRVALQDSQLYSQYQPKQS